MNINFNLNQILQPTLETRGFVPFTKEQAHSYQPKGLCGWNRVKVDPSEDLFNTIPVIEVTNVSLTEQMSIYKSLMNSLIVEKGSSDKIEEKRLIVSKLAKELLFANGDNEFKQTIDGFIDNISSVKPGRKLLKEIVNNNNKIEIIQSSNRSYADPYSNMIFIDEHQASSFYYSTIGNRVFQSPPWVVLAHELIHKLHFSSLLENCKNELQKKYIYKIMFEDKDSEGYGDIKTNILEQMDNLEEQHTITGFNHILFLMQEPLKEVDVLCENAFYLSLNLPFRINHAGAIPNSTPINNSEYSKTLTQSNYYEWIENGIESIRTISEDKYEDRNGLISFLSKNPLAFLSLKEELKSDLSFLVAVFSIMNRPQELFTSLPNLTKNKEFMLAVISEYKSLKCLEYADFELFNNKSFALNVLTSLDLNLKAIFEFIGMLTPLLQNDPEIKLNNESILKILSNCKNVYNFLFLSPEYLKDKIFVIKILDLIDGYKNEYVVKRFFEKIEFSLKSEHDIKAKYQDCLFHCKKS